jgi:single-strand DNA-binding protein
MNENTVNIVGTLGKDPELRYTTGGRGVASFSVATNRRYKKKDETEWTEQTTWFNVVAWADLGEHCAESLAKGNRVMISGRLETREYEGKDGTKRYFTEIIADNIGAELRFATCKIDRIKREGAGHPGEGAPMPTDPVYGDDEPF